MRTGNTVDQGIASRMLAHANSLLASGYNVKRDSGGKPVLDAFGRPQILPSSPAANALADADAKRDALCRYVGLLDSVRQIGVALGGGPLGGSSGGGED